jgi:acetyl-CoA acyltransferase
MKDAVIVSAVRSPVGKGKEGGALVDMHPIDLSADVIEAVVDQGGFGDGSEVDDVIWGCAYPEGPQGSNIARLALLRAGLPVSVSGATVNRFCSSGLQTVAMGAQAIMTGMAETVIAGGVELMSRIPRGGFHNEFHPDMEEAYIGMGFTAERVAERWKVSREEQDEWANLSQARANEAWEADRFTDEIVPIPITHERWHGAEKEEAEIVFDKDELLRPGTNMEGLAKLKPAFKVGGTVTAGNASPFSDGSAAVLLTSREKADAMGLEPLARLITFATAGVEPDVMGIGPVAAVPRALRQAGMSLDDIDMIELNEAFAAQVVAVMRELGLPEEKTNVNGGAIALGHPLGATGAKLTAQIVHALRKRGGGIGMVTMCVGGGMGAAGILEIYG